MAIEDYCQTRALHRTRASDGCFSIAGRGRRSGSGHSEMAIVSFVIAMTLVAEVERSLISELATELSTE